MHHANLGIIFRNMCHNTTSPISSWLKLLLLFFFLSFFHLVPFAFPGNNSFHLVCPALMQSRSDPALMKCCYPESLSLVESGPRAITWLSSGKRHIYISYFIISLGCERGSSVLTRSISCRLHHGEVIGKPVELSAK